MGRITRRAACAATAAALLTGTVQGQEEKQSRSLHAGLRAYGLPGAKLEPGNNKLCLVRDKDGRATVAKILCTVGETCMILMTDGRILTLPADKAYPSVGPFRPVHREWFKRDLRGEFGKDFKIAESKTYLYVYNCSDAYQAKCAELLEAVHAGIYKYFEDKFFAVHRPPTPLVAVIFKTREQFDKHDPAAANGVVGYYQTMSNRVVMYEESELSIADEEIAHAETLNTVAHEGVHQTLHNIGVQPRLAIWPAWVTEGLAEFFSPTVDGKTTEWKGVGQVNDRRMPTLEPYFQGAARNRGYIQSQLGLDDIDGYGYAMAWAMIHYFNTESPASLMQYLRSLSARNPMTVPEPSSGRGGYAAAEREIFERYFAMTPGEVEISLVHHLRKLEYKDPWKNVVHYVAIIEYHTATHVRRSACICLLESKAEEWRNQKYANMTPGERASATFYIKEVGSRLKAEEYANRWLNTVGQPRG